MNGHNLERIEPKRIHFHNKKTGCGTWGVFEFTNEDIKSLNDLLSMPGLDMEIKDMGE